MIAFPPSIFPRKRVIMVRKPGLLRFVDLLPSWGGPAGAA